MNCGGRCATFARSCATTRWLLLSGPVLRPTTGLPQVGLGGGRDLHPDRPGRAGRQAPDRWAALGLRGLAVGDVQRAQTARPDGAALPHPHDRRRQKEHVDQALAALERELKRALTEQPPAAAASRVALGEEERRPRSPGGLPRRVRGRRRGRAGPARSRGAAQRRATTRSALDERGSCLDVLLVPRAASICDDLERYDKNSYGAARFSDAASGDPTDPPGGGLPGESRAYRGPRKQARFGRRADWMNRRRAASRLDGLEDVRRCDGQGRAGRGQLGCGDGLVMGVRGRPPPRSDIAFINKLLDFKRMQLSLFSASSGSTCSLCLLNGLR